MVDIESIGKVVQKIESKKGVFPTTGSNNEELEWKEGEQRIEHKEIYVQRTIKISSIFLGFSCGILLFCGLGVLTISDSVLITLFGTTIATIIGLPLVIVTGLFGKS